MIQSKIKTIVVMFQLISYTLFALAASLFVRDRASRRSFYTKHVHRQSIIALDLMGFKLEIEGKSNLRPEQNYFILANHMSYMDALIMAAIRPMCFVTSMEMKETPGLGLLTEVGGCLYVERRSKENIKGEIGEITEALQEGLDVVVFPEATSTDGSKVLPFKRALLAASIQAQKPILPMVIQYEEIDGQKITAHNRDKLCWYGDMDFLPHFLEIMKHKKFLVRVKILPEIPVTAESTRDTLVDKSYELIAGSYKPIT